MNMKLKTSVVAIGLVAGLMTFSSPATAAETYGCNYYNGDADFDCYYTCNIGHGTSVSISSANGGGGDVSGSANCAVREGAGPAGPSASCNEGDGFCDGDSGNDISEYELPGHCSGAVWTGKADLFCDGGQEADMVMRVVQQLTSGSCVESVFQALNLNSFTYIRLSDVKEEQAKSFTWKPVGGCIQFTPNCVTATVLRYDVWEERTECNA